MCMIAQINSHWRLNSISSPIPLPRGRGGGRDKSSNPLIKQIFLVVNQPPSCSYIGLSMSFLTSIQKPVNSKSFRSFVLGIRDKDQIFIIPSNDH